MATMPRAKTMAEVWVPSSGYKVLISNPRALHQVAKLLFNGRRRSRALKASRYEILDVGQHTLNPLLIGSYPFCWVSSPSVRELLYMVK